MMAQLFEDPPQRWVAPKRKGGCRRDLHAGPGSCWHWWDGCPRAEERGCFMSWIRSMKARGLTEADMASLMGMGA
jgi:hypothetical protein